MSTTIYQAYTAYTAHSKGCISLYRPKAHKAKKRAVDKAGNGKTWWITEHLSTAMKNERQEELKRNNLVTAAGVVRCRFELFIRWPDSANRKINPFTQRGDKFEKEDAGKMFRFLLQYFINRHSEWRMCELYDNTIPLDDPLRVLLSYKPKTSMPEPKKGWKIFLLQDKIVHHRLHDYSESLKDFALPEWLK